MDFYGFRRSHAATVATVSRRYAAVAPQGRRGQGLCSWIDRCVHRAHGTHCCTMLRRCAGSECNIVRYARLRSLKAKVT